jgi:hypothetical protein
MIASSKIPDVPIIGVRRQAKTTVATPDTVSGITQNYNILHRIENVVVFTFSFAATAA